MGSIGTETPAGPKLPTVKLDTTLTELYKRGCPGDAGRLGWVSCGVTSLVDLTPDFPRNTKFLYQDHAFIAASRHELKNGNGKLQWSLAKKYLSHIAQRDAFVSGNAPVILFNLGQTPEQREHDRRQAEATISVLDPSQRPELIFCPGPAKIPIKEHGIDRLQYKVVLDGLQGYPLTHDVETHWFLNSKAELARSGLPTPRTDIIETDGCPPAPNSCCTLCADAARDTAHLPTIPAACTGPRGQWLAAQTARILSAVQQRAIPFVFKTQQAFGGAGTWLVTTDSQKTALLSCLSDHTPDSDSDPEEGEGLLRRLLSLLTPLNTHLHPTTILLTDLVPNPVADHGLTFIVTASGTAHFLAAAEQILTGDGSSAWVGSTIHYARQDALRARYAPLMQRIAAWVAQRGYVGPVGADVLESSSSPGSPAGGEVFIVDLNVRVSGSVALPLLRGHFVGRGLGCASSFSIVVKGGREEFIAKWRAPFEEGRMVVMSWYEDGEGGESIADVVVGGEDEARLRELVQAVREGTEEVMF
ncbi:hypothetical protein C8A03DRAFT_15106 [Achaetomium macrosporum]|uniref:ATP-grasp domain-containing protein n=1 Tax=Achaetomium macrosporum TaxID=79813 RepID=A0AAN7CCE8_9PEZI|nr:hypothetical protein C8A03DRAFT_15106 [Achaetomium macrosporum]